MTLRPIFSASMAQASPVGPAPMTKTSVCVSGPDLAFALGRVTSSSPARDCGMGLAAESVEATRVRAQLGSGDSSTRELQVAPPSRRLEACPERSRRGGPPRPRRGAEDSQREVERMPALRLGVGCAAYERAIIY